jgi:hypothetical protein
VQGVIVRFSKLLLYAILALSVVGIPSGCSDPANSESTRTPISTLPEAPVVTNLPDEDAVMPYDPVGDRDAHGKLSAAESIKDKHEMRLMSIEGVEGVGIGKDKLGMEVLMIYLRDESVKERVPREIEGLPVRTTITGQIDAY